MIDLHSHTLHSDGELLPAELVQRAKQAGYRVLAITDHADASNLDHVVVSLRQAALSQNENAGIKVIAGVEITHVPPAQIADIVRQARSLGAQLVLVHGETPVEPVAEGTNHAAILAGVDILAHPGLITMSDAKLAKQHNVTLELTSRGGHSLTNGHVGRIALAARCSLVVNSDTHAARDLHSPDLIRKVVLGAGLAETQVRACREQAERMWHRLQGK